MRTFSAHLRSPNHSVTLPDVIHFRGRDTSGSFGIMAHHERFMTVLEFGLAIIKRAEQETYYVALPSALLYFVENELFLATRRFIVTPEKEEVVTAITGILHEEEQVRTTLTTSIVEMEQELTRKLWGLQNR